MKFLIIFIITIAAVVLIPHKSEYSVKAQYSLVDERAKAKVNLAVMPVSEEIEVMKTASEMTTEQIKEYICKVFSNCDEALVVSGCESVNFTDFIGDEHLTYWENGIEYGKSYGPFQIRYLPGRPSPEQLLDPVFNTNYAHGMFVTQGWQPWTCKHRLALN